MTTKVTNIYNLKLTPSQFGQNSIVVNCSQYDSLFRVIQFNLYNGNAVYSIPDGSVVTIRGTKKDNTGFEYECDYSNNVVTFPLQQQITIFPGKVPAELRITNNGEIIGSWNFLFLVEESPLTNDTIISETDLPLLESALQAASEAENYKNLAQTSADNASASEQNASESEANALTYSQNAQTSANSASQSEANALTYSQNASESASEAQGFAQDAEDSATQSADSATQASQSASQAQTIADNIADLVDEAQGYASQSLSNAQNSAQSASQASQSATNASQSASNAQTYASNANTSAQNASSSATSAQTYASNASTSATQSASSATASAQSATNAQTYASNASASATQAQGYASNASDSATASADSATESQGYAQNASDSATEAQEAVDTIDEAIKNKADIDGAYPKLIAGDLVETETKDDVFTYQVTDHTGKANINSIKGNTLNWNQKLKIINDANWLANNIPAITWGDNEVTFTGVTSTWQGVTARAYSDIIVNHKYLLSVEAKVIASGTSFRLGSNLFGNVFIGDSDTVNSTLYTTKASIFTAPATESRQANFSNRTGTADYALRNIMLIDLTQMFGAGNEPTSVAEFTKLYPLPYYQYNAGEPLSFNGTEIKTIGFNQWDEEWEDGDINITTGQNQADSSYWRSTNYIPVLPNKQYYVYVVDSTAYTSIRVRLYGSDKQYIGSTINGNYVVPNVVFTVPNDVYFIRFAPSKSIYPTGSQFCINISSSKNGTYEPYKEETLSLPIAQYFPNGMRSANNAYDELTNSKATTRVKQITFDGSSDENWNFVLNTHRAYIEVSDIDTSTPDANVGNIMSNLYVAGNYGTGGVEDKITTRYGIAQINIFDSTNITSDSTTATWRAYLQEHPLIVNYGLATPTEEDVDLDLSYSTYEGGTEQLLPVNTGVPVTSPISMNVEFDFGENLNARFTKVLSMIAPVESAQVSQAYSVGQYLIYDYTLYKVTSAIASGGTITVGTNVTATTLASILETLQ